MLHLIYEDFEVIFCIVYAMAGFVFPVSVGIVFLIGFEPCRVRVAARHVEIAQCHVAQGRRRRQVAQHPLAHQLRQAVGIDRCGRRVLARNTLAGMPSTAAVDEKTKCATPARSATLEQVTRGAGVVAVVLERIRHRLRNDRVRGKVHHRLDRVLGEQPCDDFAVGRIADDQRRTEHRAAIAGREVVKHRRALAALDELADDVAAGADRPRGDEDRGHRQIIGDIPLFRKNRGMSPIPLRRSARAGRARAAPSTSAPRTTGTRAEMPGLPSAGRASRRSA